MYETPFVFKINENGSGPNLLLQVCLERGWQEYSEENSAKDRWNLWWRTSGFSLSHHKSLRGWQFTNHVPRGSVICKKDNLSRYLKVMRATYGSIYDFSPEAFILPLDYSKLVEQCSRAKLQKEGPPSSQVWICKPVGQSQGRGISLFRNVSELMYDTNSVVQKYVNNPLLIGGYKFDLRIYVCVPCFHPLTIYIYREGLARFSTNKFSMKDITNRYAHLTNCAINKQGPGYLEMKDKVGAGCKWSLRQLRHYLNQNGIDDWLIWQRISSLIVLTIASQISAVPMSSNCFEFYGFDILIDSDLKPWLLEVNLSPALGTDCDIDPTVKKPMLHDLFDLIGLPVSNTGLFKSLGRLYDQESFDDNQETPLTNSSAKTAAQVVAMACRWKNHLTSQNQRRKTYKVRPFTSSNNIKRNAAREARFNLRNKLAPKILNSDNSDVSYGREKSNNEELCRRQRHSTKDPPCKWDNGVDWRSGVSESGDWVRAYPLLTKEHHHNYLGEVFSPLAESKTCTRDRETRNVVLNLIRMSKLVKDIYANNIGSSDERKDSVLLNEYAITDAVWHPAPGFHEEIS